ncbi:hypothetical protein J4447_01475 [Candidatus Pacearchaeota archaeon]|nr:hypothetical protein [Candidatus Pacearchaeota archaeon]
MIKEADKRDVKVLLTINPDKRAQVWIETVIYLLIGLAVVGVLLAFIKPQIDSAIDKSFIEKSIESLNKIDSTVNEIYYVTGNSRVLILGLKKGEMFINSTADIIILTIPDSKHEYSEIGKEVEIPGTRLKVLTREEAGRKDVVLTLDYSDYINVTYDSIESNKVVQSSQNPYTLIIRNNGVYNNITNVDFKIAG